MGKKWDYFLIKTEDLHSKSQHNVILKLHSSLEEKTLMKSKIRRDDYKHSISGNSIFHWYGDSCSQWSKLWVIQSDGYFRSWYSLMTEANISFLLSSPAEVKAQPRALCLSSVWRKLMCKEKDKMEACSKW